MNYKKTLGAALIVVGALMLFSSNYIARQVADGRAQVQKAQSQVDTIDSVFSMSKYSKPVGKTITGSAQKRIDAGQSDIDKYTAIATSLKIGGIIAIGIGAFMFLFLRKK